MTRVFCNARDIFLSFVFFGSTSLVDRASAVCVCVCFFSRHASEELKVPAIINTMMVKST